MSETQSTSEVYSLKAVEHMDPDGSVVRSGALVAEAALKALEDHKVVELSFDGLKGASSSYFNVFLRRIEEGCGLAEIGRHIRLMFGSSVQKMVFDRSHEAMRKEPRPMAVSEKDTSQPVATASQTFWSRFVAKFRRSDP